MRVFCVRAVNVVFIRIGRLRARAEETLFEVFCVAVSGQKRSNIRPVLIRPGRPISKVDDG